MKYIMLLSLLLAACEPIPSSPFDPSGSRLEARFQIGDDGSRRQTSEWLDTVRGEICRPMRASDGVMRCLPGDYIAPAGVYFSAPSCDASSELFAMSLTCAGAAPVVLREQPADCGSTFRVSGLGAPYAGGIYALHNGCVPVPRDDAYAYHALGVEVPASAFVAFSAGP